MGEPAKGRERRLIQCLIFLRGCPSTDYTPDKLQLTFTHALYIIRTVVRYCSNKRKVNEKSPTRGGCSEEGHYVRRIEENAV